ncbi:MAG: hypothetical protein RRC07_08150 [Anaerolineae bacterium]|nr:hypothetical protein [Anaerolineae bacterium]
MPTANYSPGELFPLHFVWQLPSGDFLRAVFQAEVIAHDLDLDRYLLRLAELLAGRQETPQGEMRPKEEMDLPFWKMVTELIGKRVYLAFEVDDGRPIRLRLDTLTQEHRFFRMLDGEPDERG